MDEDSFSALRGRRVLLLQGPLGPFFRRLARNLKKQGARVYKVNFNGGDWLFYPSDAIAFREGIEAWPAFVHKLLAEMGIDLIMLFGDCRPVHRAALEIAKQQGIEVAVFEEGYIRPDFITLERSGVNGHSSIPKDPNYYLSRTWPSPEPSLPIGKTFWYAAAWAVSYYSASTFLRPFFRHYRHHRPLTLLETGPWARALWRKGYFALKERNVQECLESEYSGQYFLVPLQVHNDAQIHVHSDFVSVKAFIRHLIHSFAAHAPAGTMLVIKHHPMDRGYHDYTRFIAAVAKAHQLADRILYVHDLHLPTLLQHARGVVVINSTVGLSALHHQRPLKVCGDAIYDMEGLTYQGALQDFWKEAQDFCVDPVLLQHFQNYLIHFTQLNGNFYKRLKVPGSHTGIRWSEKRAQLKSLKSSMDELPFIAEVIR